MHRLLLAFFFLLIANTLPAQQTIERPRLVVGIVIDQMRWDYLYRYYSHYAEDGGFKRMIREGFSCENTFIPFTPTLTACGHASIFTGSVPAINGITGNDWWDYNLSQYVYCTQDDSATTVGSHTTAGQMSPRNLLVTTIGDELRLATNFRSKVIGISLKDRAAILPAGHSANGAYWYDDKTGDWISSSYYLDALPKWVKELNGQKQVDKYFSQDWNTLYPVKTYVESTAGEETRPSGFPYGLKQYIGKNYGLLAVTPYGNSFTFDLARAAINGEHLGADTITDLLTISISTPDYIGHSFGPNSIEAEDDFLRLDKDLGDFFRFLDTKVGKGAYLVFLSSDHGTAHVPAFIKNHKMPAGNVLDQQLSDEINRIGKQKFHIDTLVIGIINYQVYLDREAIEKAKVEKAEIYKEIIGFLSRQPGIARVFATDAMATTTLNEKIKNAVTNGYYPPRSGDIQIVLQPGWILGFANGGTTHGVWNPYDAHIPLLWFGWNVQQGKTNRETYMTDIAPTLAAMLHIQMPSGSVGKVITEVSK